MNSSNINPILASSDMTSAYARYLSSLLPLTDANLAERIAGKLGSTDALSKGPFLEATPPFKSGASLSDLINEGILPVSLGRLDTKILPLDRPLYQHQEDAIRKGAAGRNLVIATGTGSGKTESFLVPILSALFDEHSHDSLNPGVRALLLYPMNALANDQLKRLREILENHPEITFGRYTGETKETTREALEHYQSLHGGDLPLENELVSREQMRSNPPHILLTNYAMLEYLLLRPDDMDLFEGPHAGSWSHLVVDEAHVYDGVNGSEIAFLLRRLQDRLQTPKIQCFASSATVGSEMNLVARFANDLFDQPFEWDPEDSDRQDVVEATRIDQSVPPTWGPLTEDQLEKLVDAEDLEIALSSMGSGSLVEEHLTQALISRLLKGPQSFSETASDLFPDLEIYQRERALVHLVDIAHRALDFSGAPILNARYHLFVSALDGGFVCLADPADPHVELARHNECPTCSQPMFEVAACKSCGQLHVLGNPTATPHGTSLKSRSRSSQNKLVWIMVSAQTEEVDEEDDFSDTPSNSQSSSVQLCTNCGLLNSPSAKRCAGCASSNMRVGIRVDSNHDLNICNGCGTSAPQQIRRLSTGNDAAIAVLISDLYRHLPIDKNSLFPGEGRKLLMFADSRQQAAYAAPNLELSYQNILYRRQITKGLQHRQEFPQSSLDLVRSVVGVSRKDQLFSADQQSMYAQEDSVAQWIHREAIEGSERNSLEGLTLATLRLQRPDGHPPAALTNLGLTKDQAWDLLEVLVHSMRHSGALAVEYGDTNVQVAKEFFAPRNREYYFRGTGSDRSQNVHSWSPTHPAKSNKRLVFLEQILERLGVKEDPSLLLDNIWRYLISSVGPRWFKSSTLRSIGQVYQVDNVKLGWQLASTTTPFWICSLCQRKFPYSVLEVCPAGKCKGELEPLAPELRLTMLEKNHYAKSYREMGSLPLTAREHTAQLARDDASRLQERFNSGEVNVLSCSTTFEMGVDVGDLQCVFLRNVPPTTANYIQRAGRAGRRASSAALVVTFVQMRSHDQYMYADPLTMIKGEVRAPRISLNNLRIARRHSHSIAISSFLRSEKINGRTYRNNQDFYKELDSAQSGASRFIEFILNIPKSVVSSIKQVSTPNLYRKLDVEGSDWGDKLCDGIQSGSDYFLEESGFFEELMDSYAKDRKYKAAEAMASVLKTINSRPLFSELSKTNILPKYGFPVDTVSLAPPSGLGSSNLQKLDLSRDLSIAINEYSPGNSIVARGQIITSGGIAKRPSRELVEKKYAICNSCGDLETSLGTLNEICMTCDSPRRGVPYTFVFPEYGFVSERETKRVGLKRPSTQWNSKLFVTGFGERTQADKINTVVGPVEWNLGIEAELCALNEGTNGTRFAYCSGCGFAATGQYFGKKRAHKNPRSGRDCTGMPRSVALGYQYETDILFIKPLANHTLQQARALLYALLNAASDKLELLRNDIDGTVIQGRDNTLALFDLVPGGAGLVKEIAKKLPELFEAALDRVESCDCGIETSCYRCLRVYRNQIYHEQLTRQLVIETRVRRK